MLAVFDSFSHARNNVVTLTDQNYIIIIRNKSTLWGYTRSSQKINKLQSRYSTVVEWRQMSIARCHGLNRLMQHQGAGVVNESNGYRDSVRRWSMISHTRRKETFYTFTSTEHVDTHGAKLAAGWAEIAMLSVLATYCNLYQGIFVRNTSSGVYQS